MSHSLKSVSRAAMYTQRIAQAQAYERNGARGIHRSLRRQAIMMPAMSPFISEGTITRWKKKEGEAFKPGDVLLEIESDIAMIDVEAQSPGILGRILLPDGTTNVPVEQVIALVARDTQELEMLQSLNVSTPPPFNPIPEPPSTSLSPISRERPRPPPIKTHRNPSLYELQSMGQGIRGLATGCAMSFADALSPLRSVNMPEVQSTGPLSAGFELHPMIRRSVDAGELDGAAIRRKILANLIENSSKSPYALWEREQVF